MSTYGPSFAGNSFMINSYIVAGATLDSSTFRSILNDLNISGYSIGLAIGDTLDYVGPTFSGTSSIIQNIMTAYTSAISYYNTSPGSGLLLSGGVLSVDRYSMGSTGTNNYGFGTDNLIALTTGQGNIAFGSNAQAAVTSGSDNIALGTSAIRNNKTGSNNIGIGNGSLNNNQTGTNNIALGYGAIFGASTGSLNISIGDNALYSSATGSENTVIGGYGLYSNIGGSYNIAIGRSALQNSVASAFNVAIGHNALAAPTVGSSRMTMLGAYAGNTSQFDSKQNITAIGYNAANGFPSGQIANNIAIIGDSNVTNVFKGNGETIATQGYVGSSYFTLSNKTIASSILTAGNTIAAGGTGAAPLYFSTGTNLTTPVNGALEFDGTLFYSTTTGNNIKRGIIPSIQYKRLSTTTTLTNTNLAQTINGLGGLSVYTGKVYEIEGMIVLYSTIPAGTARNMFFGIYDGASALSTTNALIAYNHSTGSTTQNVNANLKQTNSTSLLQLVSATSTVNEGSIITFKGTIAPNVTSNNIYPAIQYSAGASFYTPQIGSYFKITPIA
jgi:hypothetical protein